MSGHPGDGEQARPHPQPPPPEAPHTCQWMPVMNDWKEIVAYACTCGGYRNA